ncbi:hypothetical protein [uncultured Serinicoccus sp.]|uniref:hypothetical protein n=1 Tax=uncultured Serinicoccus sp. TaxID=735514 RepID=UPI002616B178|nr:hypothetical protein [uncultured Serinicoccus sp.]
MNEPPGSEPVRADGMHRLVTGGVGEDDAWHRARTTCTACGSGDLMDEGFLTSRGNGTTGHVEWVEEPPSTDIFGFAALDGVTRHPVRAFRCRECRHLELFAEEHE